MSEVLLQNVSKSFGATLYFQDKLNLPLGVFGVFVLFF